MIEIISDAAIDLIIAEEITDRAYYAKRYRNFQWPGGASGPTVGIGYDCGYAPRDEIAADWAGIIPKEMILALLEASGRKGAAAGAWVKANAQRVDISYEQAERQFRERELPKWVDRVRRSLPRFDDLPPDCAGAIVSLAYNRGCSWAAAGPRYAEMRAIWEHMQAGEFAAIPDEIRSMARLWDNGVAQRRMREADLFARGLEAVPAVGGVIEDRHAFLAGERPGESIVPRSTPPPIPPAADAQPSGGDILFELFGKIGSRGLAALGSRSATCIRYIRRLLGLGATGAAGVGLMGGELGNELSPVAVCFAFAAVFALGMLAAHLAEHFLVKAARDGRYRPRDAA